MREGGYQFMAGKDQGMGAAPPLLITPLFNGSRRPRPQGSKGRGWAAILSPRDGGTRGNKGNNRQNGGIVYFIPDLEINFFC